MAKIWHIYVKKNIYIYSLICNIHFIINKCSYQSGQVYHVNSLAVIGELCTWPHVPELLWRVSSTEEQHHFLCVHKVLSIIHVNSLGGAEEKGEKESNLHRLGEVIQGHFEEPSLDEPRPTRGVRSGNCLAGTVSAESGHYDSILKVQKFFSCQSDSRAGMKTVAADTVAMVTWRSVSSLKMFHLWDFAFLFSYWGQAKNW